MQNDSKTWIAIEVHNTKKGMKIMGTAPTMEQVGDWFTGAGSLGDLPRPDWYDELRLTEQPSGKILHVYRLGWVEVKKKIEVVQ